MEGEKQGASERKNAEVAGTSQGAQGRGLSQEKDDDDGLPNESPAKSTSKCVAPIMQFPTKAVCLTCCMFALRFPARLGMIQDKTHNPKGLCSLP